jgi:iron complex outermembrane receptor protein
MKNTFIITILFFVYHASFAQKMEGSVKDKAGKPISNASVILKKTVDSGIIKISLSDKDGKFVFNPLHPGNYFISISHVGFVPVYSSLFNLHDTAAIRIDLVMDKTIAALKEVVVVSRKPMIEVKADKIILNIENSVTAVGQNALELLRKSPGVTIDKDENLKLNGKNGVQVYIDGRPSPLTGKDLGDYLQSVPSSLIEAIEIISNPSAKYDAAGSAGIINIRLKKSKSYGTNGSVTAGYNIATYSKYNASISLNHRDKNINLFGNYSYNNGLYGAYNDIFRSLGDTSFDQTSTIRSKNIRHTLKAGLDYTINKRNTMGIMISGLFTSNNAHTEGNNMITYVPLHQTAKILQANNENINKRNIGTLNLNYRYTDTLGYEWNMDADYGTYALRTNQLQPDYYFDSTGNTLLYSNTYNLVSPSDISIYSFKTDYTQNFAKGKLGIGAKTSFVNSDNNFKEYAVYPSVNFYDSAHSNHFLYRENINALYVNYNRTLKGLELQAGLRMEQTNVGGYSNGYQLLNNNFTSYDSSFHLHYLNLFPSAAVTFNRNPKQQWTITYSYRIDRPAYRDLNPFEIRIDNYTYRKGNTQLRPQFTNSIGLTYLWNRKLTATINYSHVKNVFTVLTDTIDVSKAFFIKINLASQDIASVTVSYPFQYKNYNVFINANTYYTLYQANFGTGRLIHSSVFAFSANVEQSVHLGKGWTGQLSTFYTSPSIIQGTFRNKAVGSVDAGIQKIILKNKASISASISDLFNSMHNFASSDFAGQKFINKSGEESRQLRLNFTYRFGNKKVKAERQRKIGIEEEGRRTNG